MVGRRVLLKERAPISPVSVLVLSILSTPAFENISLFFAAGGCPERTECEVPVMAETLLALLLRPLTLEIGSVKGIVPPFEACIEANVKFQGEYPKAHSTKRWR